MQSYASKKKARYFGENLCISCGEAFSKRRIALNFGYFSFHSDTYPQDVLMWIFTYP